MKIKRMSQSARSRGYVTKRFCCLENLPRNPHTGEQSCQANRFEGCEIGRLCVCTPLSNGGVRRDHERVLTETEQETSKGVRAARQKSKSGEARERHEIQNLDMKHEACMTTAQVRIASRRWRMRLDEGRAQAAWGSVGANFRSFRFAIYPITAAT